MKNKLLLVTNYYPFYRGEEYIESEIDYLAKKFDEIVIIPVMANATMKQTRQLPENVVCFNLKVDHSIKGKASMLSKQLMPAIRSSKAKRSTIEQVSRNHLFDLYFETRVREVTQRALPILEPFMKDSHEASWTIYSYWFYLAAAVAAEVKAFYFKDDTSVQMFSRAHGYDINEFLNRFNYLPYREYLFDQFDRIFFVSELTRDRIAEKYPQYASKMQVHRLGVHRYIDDLTCLESKRVNQPFVIVSCSTIRPLKQLEWLIENLSLLASRHVDFKWIHIGTGQANYVAKIQKLAQEGLPNGSYEFVGHIDNRQIHDFYAQNSVSVFVNTSKSEGVPVSVMEAQAYGIPVVATDVGGTSEIVHPKVNGWLIPSDNNNATIIADVLESVAQMSLEDYRQLSDKTLALWSQLSDAQMQYTNFSQLLGKE